VPRYTHQSALITLFYRWLVDQSAWALPVLYVLLRDLRDLAEQVGPLSHARPMMTDYRLGRRYDLRFDRTDALSGGMYADGQ